MLKISKYVVFDILRNRVLIGYTLFLLVISFTLFNFQSDISKSIVSLMSVVMIIVPLVSIVFTTTYFYNSYEFIELLVAQPLSRRTIIMGEYLGIGFSMLFALLVGIGIPICFYSINALGLMLIYSGACMTMVFVSLAFFASVITRDKAKGIGVSLMMWFYFSVLYDALVLGILFAFSDYPIEKAVIAMTSLNPIDLGRILILLKLDISALMGYTGALYQNFFGSSTGIIYSSVLMLLWIIIPMIFVNRVFRKKNL